MAYVYVQDVASSWAEYERATAALVDPAPTGLIVHIAGPTDEGVRIIDVWDDEHAAQLFLVHRLSPLIAALALPATPHSTFRELHPQHVVLSNAWPSAERNAP